MEVISLWSSSAFAWPARTSRSNECAGNGLKAYSKGKEIAVGSEVRATRAPNHALVRISSTLDPQDAFLSCANECQTEQETTIEVESLNVLDLMIEGGSYHC